MSNLTIRCVAFDADNTLYQTRQAAQGADMEAMKLLAAASGKNPETLYQEFKTIVQTIKDSTDPKIRHRLHSYGILAGNSGVTDPAMPARMIEALETNLLQNLKMVAGVDRILETLAARGIHLVVITEDNHSRTEKKLETLGLRKFFAQVIASDDVGIMKPSPKYYEGLLGQFKAPEILVVGDNQEKDLAIPAQLGMRTVLVLAPEDLGKIPASLD